MPWWVWLLCGLWLLVALAIGIAYAIIHALRLAHSVGETGQKISGPLGEMGKAQAEHTDPSDPAFVQPLKMVVDRYVDAHAHKLQRKTTIEDHHAEAWDRWAKDDWSNKE